MFAFLGYSFAKLKTIIYFSLCEMIGENYVRLFGIFFCEAKNNYIFLSLRNQQGEKIGREYFTKFRTAIINKIDAKRIIGFPIGVLISYKWVARECWESGLRCARRVAPAKLQTILCLLNLKYILLFENTK